MMIIMTYKPLDIILVKFSFTNQSQRKRRPAVIISSVSYNNAGKDVIALAITSQPQGNDSLIVHWIKTGLNKPSWIKPLIATFENSIIIKKLGELTSTDKSIPSDIIRAIIDRSLLYRNVRSRPPLGDSHVP